MAESISWEIREAAYDAYVTDGMTYEQVTAMTGVSLSQLKRWGQEDGWGDARKEYRQALQSIRRDTVKLRAGLLQKALDSKDSQDVYAFAALEKIEASRKTGTVTTAPQSLDKTRDIKTPEDAVAALDEVVEMRLNRLLSSPQELKLSDVNELKKTMELIDGMRRKYTTTQDADEKSKGFDADQVEKIRALLEG